MTIQTAVLVVPSAQMARNALMVPVLVKLVSLMTIIIVVLAENNAQVVKSAAKTEFVNATRVYLEIPIIVVLAVPSVPLIIRAAVMLLAPLVFLDLLAIQIIAASVVLSAQMVKSALMVPVLAQLESSVMPIIVAHVVASVAIIKSAPTMTNANVLLVS